MFIVKKHEPEPKKVMLAIIDNELKGKKLTEGNKILNLKAKFYDGEEKSEEETLKLIGRAENLNVVGQNIINLLKKHKLIDKAKEIDGCPYTQLILLH